MFRKVKGAAEKAIKSDTAKLAISKGLELVPELYTKGCFENQKQKDQISAQFRCSSQFS